MCGQDGGTDASFATLRRLSTPSAAPPRSLLPRLSSILLPAGYLLDFLIFIDAGCGLCRRPGPRICASHLTFPVRSAVRISVGERVASGPGACTALDTDGVPNRSTAQ
jgi:hypothetical protein